MDGDTPDLHVATALQLQGGIVGIGGLQSQSTAMACQSLECETAIEHRHDHSTRPGVEAAVHHQQIAVMNAGAGHGITAHSQKKCAAGMADQLVVEIDSHLHVIVRGGGKACGHPFASQGQEKRMALGAQGLR